MEKYMFLILVSVALVGVTGIALNSNSSSITGATFLSEKLCGKGFTSMLYVEQDRPQGYFRQTVLCVEGQVPDLRGRFVLGESNAASYDAFRSDPYRFRQY